MPSFHLLADSYSSYFSISIIISHYPANLLHAYKSSFIIKLTRRVLHFHFTFPSFHSFLRAGIVSPPTPAPLASQDRSECLYLICLLSTCYISSTNKGENEILLLLLTFPHLFQKQICKDTKTRTKSTLRDRGNLSHRLPAVLSTSGLQIKKHNCSA